MKEYTTFLFNPATGKKLPFTFGINLAQFFKKVPSPSGVFTFNPYTGERRAQDDIISDPYGFTLVENFEKLKVSEDKNDILSPETNVETPVDDDLFYYYPTTGLKIDPPASKVSIMVYMDFVANSLAYNYKGVWYFNPYTGDERHPLDIESDPYGRAIVNSFKNIKVPNKNMSDDKNQNSTQETNEGDPMSEDTPKSYKRVGQFKVSNDILYDDSGNIELDTFVNEMFSRVKVLEAIDVYDQGYTLYKGICEEFDGVEFIPYKGPHKTLITITIGELPEYQFVVSKVTTDLINLSKGTEDQSHHFSYKFEKV